MEAGCIENIHRKKYFSIFPSPAGMSLTKLSLGGNNDVINKLFPPKESLVSDIPSGEGNIEKLFYGVWAEIRVQNSVKHLFLFWLVLMTFVKIIRQTGRIRLPG
jgi:hypothetical protein